jgi:acyl carrier protein
MVLSRIEIQEKLKSILVKVSTYMNINLNNVTEKSNLTTDLGFNSMGLIYIMIVIEETFSIKFQNVTSDNFVTIEDVIDYIEKEVKKNDLDT